MFSEHVPQRPKLSDQVRVDLVWLQGSVMEALAKVMELAIVAEVIEIVVLANQRVLPHLLDADSGVGIGDEHAANEIFGFRAQILWYFVYAPLGFLQQCSDVRIIERQACSQKCIENDSQRPYVRFVSAVMLVLQKLGSGVVRAAASCNETMVRRLVQGSHAKVGNFDFVVGSQQNVLGFEIAMTDVEGMTVLESAHHLSKEKHGALLYEATIVIDVVK